MNDFTPEQRKLAIAKKLDSRADRAYEATFHYSQLISPGSTMYLEESLIDMMVDIRHLIDRHNRDAEHTLDFARLAEISEGHYEAEASGDDFDEAPFAYEQELEEAKEELG